MDSERTLRFVIAPGLLLGWIALGKVLAGDGSEIVNLLKETDSVGKAITLVATTGAVLTVVGYVMSLITVVLFHLLRIFCVHIEVPLRQNTIERMKNKLIANEKQNGVTVTGFSRLAIVVMYQARFWNEHAIKWAERRWMNVGICANGILAVAGALVLGHYVFDTPLQDWWIGLSVGLIVLFLIHLIMTVAELSRMHYVGSFINNTKT